MLGRLQWIIDVKPTSDTYPRVKIMTPFSVKPGLHVLVFCTSVVLGIVAVGECSAQQRTWTDVSGTYKIEAELTGVTETETGLQAELVMADGKHMAIQIAQLCEADRLTAKAFYDESKKVKAPESKPVETKPAEPKTSPTESKKPVNSGKAKPPVVVKSVPEDAIVSRPLGAAVKRSWTRDNQTTTVNFDPATAIRLDREIARDEKGRPAENPAYTVEVTSSELMLLPRKAKALVLELMDSNVAVDVKRRAIESLKENWPQRRHPGLLKVLINTLSDDDKFLRLAALDLLANHDSDQSLIYIFARIDDISFDVRWRTYEILAQLRDPRIIPELCERLDGPERAKISSVLQVFGSASVQWVYPWLENSTDERVLLNVCQLLGRIGEKDSLEKLDPLKSHESLLVRSQSENSIKQIQTRLSKRASKSPTRR